MTTDKNLKAIDPGVRIGHVHLKVSDLQRSIHFYCDVLGFEITQRYGSQAVFISAGGYHHHIGLNTWESFGGSAPPPGFQLGCSTSLFFIPAESHLRKPFDALLKQASLLMEPAITESVKHCICVIGAENGIELYWDRPKDEWPRTPDGELAMFTQRLDMNRLLQEAGASS